MGTVVKLPKPRVYDSREKFIDAVREAIFKDGRPYHVIAAAVGVSATTVRKLASGDTHWPRHTTLFPLLSALGRHIALI